MSRKRKRQEEQHSLPNGNTHNGEASADNVKTVVGPSRQDETVAVATLQSIHAAFTASTLLQEPLIQAFQQFDRCIAATDWTSSNPNRDTIIAYLDTNPDFLPTLTNLWSFAWDQNFQKLLHQVADTLRQFLHNLNHSITLLSIASRIANEILDTHVKTIYRILSSDKTQQIATTINLLIEITSIPKSSCADSLYRLVVAGFNAWPSLLSKKGSMREKEIRKAAQIRKTDRRTEIRASSVQLLLSLIERGGMTTKENLLNNRALTSPLIKFLALDSDEIILSVIETLKTHVLNDKKLARAVKTGFFASENLLSRLITLAEHDDIHSEQLTNTVEQFLVDACTIPGNGICFEDRGWYPRADTTATDEVESKLHNVILYRFLIQLRPVENIFHRTLALAILKQSQELVAPYFARLQISNNVNLTFSLISSLSLWTEIIDLPLPNPFGDTTGLPEDPPPIAIIIGSIMPAIFTKAYLSSGIQSGKPLVRLYMLQLVYTVLNKVQLLKTAAQSGNQKWHDQFDTILETVSRRLPDPQTVLKVYTTSSEHQLNASAAVKVLVLYTDLLSAISAMPRIDAKLITSALQTEWDFTSPTGFFNQLYFLRVIHEQGDINWWSKQGRSLLRTLLEKRLATENFIAKSRLDEVLESLFRRSHAFQTITVISPVFEMSQAIETVVAKDTTGDAKDAILDFVEEAISRFMPQPYSYFDMVALLAEKATGAEDDEDVEGDEDADDQEDEGNAETESHGPHLYNDNLGPDKFYEFDEGAKGIKRFSPIIITFGRLWQRLGDKDNYGRKWETITRWFCEFIQRLLLIGESRGPMKQLLLEINLETQDLWEGCPSAKERKPREMFKVSHLEFPEDLQGLFAERRVGAHTRQVSIVDMVQQYKTKHFGLYAFDVIHRLRDQPEMAICEAISFLTRVLIVLYLQEDRDIIEENGGERAFYYLFQLLSFQRSRQKNAFQTSKRAIVQTFIFLTNGYRVRNLRILDLLEPFTVLLAEYYTHEDIGMLGDVLTGLNDSWPHLVPLSWAHLSDCLQRTSHLLNQSEKKKIASSLLDVVQPRHMNRTFKILEPYVSYCIECLENLLQSSEASWTGFTPHQVKVMFHLACARQPSLLTKIVEFWFHHRTSELLTLEEYIVSSPFLWNEPWSAHITPFEVEIFGNLYYESKPLRELFQKKLFNCHPSIITLRSALQIADFLSSDSSTLDTFSMQDSLQRYFESSERLVRGHLDIAADPLSHSFVEELWELVPGFILHKKTIDLESWLGQVCKDDEEHLNPLACAAVQSIFTRNPQAFHRRLPGWFVCTFSRFTRRFAEDEVLSERTLASVKEFDSLIASIKKNEGVKSLILSKVSYLETMTEAAVKHHLQCVKVSQLIVTILSVLKFRTGSLNEAHLLQSVLSQRIKIEISLESALDSLTLRSNIASIIERLFLIDPSRNSSESTLVGILRMFNSSTGPADQLLMKILVRLDADQLNIVSSAETWNAFRSVWSIYHTEAIASSLDSPFALVDTEDTKRNVWEFQLESSLTGKLDKLEDLRTAYRTYDPLFWLPIIAYCLQTVTHPSQLTVMIENYSIGYALVCLSSEREEVRKMAGSILVRWEYMSEEYRLRERNQIKILMNGIRNVNALDATVPRIPKLITVFLSEALQVLVDPKHILYEKVSVFFLQRPSLELDDIPMFYTLSNSGDYFEQEVSWLLEILSAGVDDPTIVNLIKRRHVVEFCLGLYRARTGRAKTGKSKLPQKVFELLKKMCEKEYLKSLLVGKYGLEAWINQEGAFETNSFSEDIRRLFSDIKK